MILDLTANPLEVAAHEGNVEGPGLGAFGEQANGYHEVQPDQPQTDAQSHALSTNPSQLTFMQASELDQANHTQQPVDAIGEGYQVLPQADTAQKTDYHQDSAAPEVTQQSLPLMDITNTMAATKIDNTPVDPLSSRETQPINSWADEVDQANTPPPAATEAPANMFGGHRGQGRRGNENGPRGGRGMRGGGGGFRGRGRPADASGNSADPRPVNADGWSQVGQQQHQQPSYPRGRGSFRGNNEGGRGGGRGRGSGEGHAHRASLAGEWRPRGGPRNASNIPSPIQNQTAPST